MRIKKIEFEVFRTDDSKVILKRILPGRNESKEKFQKELALPKMRVHFFTETRFKTDAIFAEPLPPRTG